MVGEALERTLPRKVAWRLIPILIAAYVMAHLDRINVGFAALTMNEELGFSASVYGLGASLFFFGYLLFEIPSNLLLQRYGARRLITAIMVIWGGVSASLALVNTAGFFYLLRFVLGIAESGLYPGAMLYITYWFAPRHRAGAVALFGLALAIGGLIGGPVSGFLLDSMDGVGGLSGWRWLFILEGLPTVLLALLVWLWLDDRPQQASWLSPAEKSWLRDNLPSSGSGAGAADHPGWRESLSQLGEGRIWMLALIYLLYLGALAGIMLWAPKLLQFRLPALHNATIGWIVGGSYLPFAVGMLWWGRRSDRRAERPRHVLQALLLGAVGMAMLIPATGLVANLAALLVIMAGMGAALSTLWGLVTDALGHRLAAVGIAVVNSAGALGSFITITLLGVLRDATGDYAAGLTSLLVSTLAGGAVVYLVAARYLAHPDGVTAAVPD